MNANMIQTLDQIAKHQQLIAVRRIGLLGLDENQGDAICG